MSARARWQAPAAMTPRIVEGPAATPADLLAGVEAGRRHVRPFDVAVAL